jgi:hypothetical protein
MTQGWDMIVSVKILVFITGDDSMVDHIFNISVCWTGAVAQTVEHLPH